VSETITEHQLNDVYSDPYIQKVGHDSRPAAIIKHPNVAYLSAWVGDQFAGAFMVIKFSSVEFELHSLLKKSAVLHSRQLGKKFLQWAFENHQILRVTAYIIEGLDAAKNYCLKLGFKLEGCRRDACMQNGIVKDVHILGMTRTDWSLL
jgi:hypothetical protein